jgi:hypothetical protein
MRQSHLFFGKRPIFKGVRIAGMVVFGIVAAAVFGLVFGYLVMLLWNWLMPAIFGITTITYWQAFGIVILAKLIFGALGRGKDHDHDRDHERYREKFFRKSAGSGSPEDEEDRFDRFRRYRYYHEFWNEEGKDAFDRYVRKREEGGTGEEEP